jgi:hypothetical protein
VLRAIKIIGHDLILFKLMIKQFVWVSKLSLWLRVCWLSQVSQNPAQIKPEVLVYKTGSFGSRNNATRSAASDACLVLKYLA